MATAGTRAKDSDRNSTCQILDSAFSDGQLSMEEHRQRVAAATAAATLGELKSLVSDLQTAKTAEPVSNPQSRRNWIRSVSGGGWGPRLGGAALLVVAGIGVGWGLYGNTSSPLNFTSDPGAKPDGVAPVVLTPPRLLQSVGGLTGLFEQMRQKFGDTKGYELTVFKDYASLERADPHEPRRVLNYTYRGGWGDPSETNAGSDSRIADLAQLDVATLVGVIRGAPETLGINPAEVESTHITIQPNSDITAPPGSIEMAVYISPKFGNSGYIELNGDGTIKRISYPDS